MDTELTTTASDTVTITGNTGSCNSNWIYTPGCSSTYYSYSKVRLTFAEMQHLLKAAKADNKLRDILSKFENSIEVVVEFDAR